MLRNIFPKGRGKERVCGIDAVWEDQTLPSDFF
jgi:hypothetical protein